MATDWAKIGNALTGFGAGLTGQGPQWQAIQAQNQMRQREYDRLSAETKAKVDKDRRDAFFQDFDAIGSLLEAGDLGMARRVLSQRKELLGELGAEDTEETDAMDILLGMAEQGDTEALKKAQDFIGSIRLWGQASGAIKPQGAAERGLSPLYFQDEQGNYRIGQLSKEGGLSMVETPEGLRVVPDAARMGYDPSMIGVRGGAETDVAANRAQVLAPIEAEAAGMATAAQEAARTAAIPQRVDAETQAERMAEQPQRTAAQASQERKYEMVSGLIDKALNQANSFTTGLIGSSLSNIPGTEARDLKGTVDTIRANIGFSQLQEMRDNSPTGGALGQVSEMENRLLQALLGNLEQSQSPKQFKENLELVQSQLDQIIHGNRQQYSRMYGSEQTPAPQSQRSILDEADAIINRSAP